MSVFTTSILYLSIFLSTTLMAHKSQRKTEFGCKFNGRWLLMSFLIHWFFLSFTNIGADYNTYFTVAQNISLDAVFDTYEFGFYLTVYLLKLLFSSSHVVLFFIKTISVLIFYLGFYLIRNDADLGLSVLAFNAFLYVRCFYLLSMYFSIAFLFLSIIFLINKRSIKSFCFLTIACTIHASTFLFVPIYLLLFSMEIVNKKKFGAVKIVFITIAYLGILNYSVQIYEYAVNNLDAFKHYVEHSLITEYSGSGLMQYVYFVPILYFVYLMFKNIESYRIKNAAIIFSFSAFLFALLGYKIEVFSRTIKSFFALYGFIIPMLFYYRKHDDSKLYKTRKFIFSYSVDISFWITYIVWRGVDEFYSAMQSISTAQVNSYHFFWPF